ncbi:MAG: hypothetical protein D6741_20050 [Planctomycetota bacterium]|nr:MAG: hypothetical protein D6741_20050 [Planctomycetota bacterium]
MSIAFFVLWWGRLPSQGTGCGKYVSCVTRYADFLGAVRGKFGTSYVLHETCANSTCAPKLGSTTHRQDGAEGVAGRSGHRPMHHGIASLIAPQHTRRRVPAGSLEARDVATRYRHCPAV